MVKKLYPARIVLAVVALFCMLAGAQAAENRPPAGQMCREGSYVIGFDSDSNIICSGVASTVAPEAAEVTRQVEGQRGDNCPPNCPPAASVDNGAVATDKLVIQRKAVSGIATPVISKLKPGYVVFGAKETSITIIGSGFNADSAVKFQGTTYTPTVNPTGTELNVTIATRDLAMGFYAISISNGPDLETTRPRALEVY